MHNPYLCLICYHGNILQLTNTLAQYYLDSEIVRNIYVCENVFNIANNNFNICFIFYIYIYIYMVPVVMKTAKYVFKKHQQMDIHLPDTFHYIWWWIDWHDPFKCYCILSVIRIRSVVDGLQLYYNIEKYLLWFILPPKCTFMKVCGNT